MKLEDGKTRPTKDQLAAAVGQLRVALQLLSTRFVNAAAAVELDQPRQLVVEDALTKLHDACKALEGLEAALSLSDEYVDTIVKPGIS